MCEYGFEEELDDNDFIDEVERRLRSRDYTLNAEDLLGLVDESDVVEFVNSFDNKIVVDANIINDVKDCLYNCQKDLSF
jgi:hypothetical protein